MVAGFVTHPLDLIKVRMQVVVFSQQIHVIQATMLAPAPGQLCSFSVALIIENLSA